MARAEDSINFLELLVVVISRKIDFLSSLHNQLLKDPQGKTVSESEAMKGQLVEIISKLDPSTFLTKKEMENRMIDLSNTLDDLDKERIWKMISDNLYERK